MQISDTWLQRRQMLKSKLLFRFVMLGIGLSIVIAIAYSAFINQRLVLKYADSTCKCNFDDGLKEQAAVAALRFSNTTYQRTKNELRTAYPGATISDCRAQESRTYAG